LLGDLFYEAKGKIIGQRVLDVNNGPKIETSVSYIGMMKGTVNVTHLATFRSIPKSDGLLYAEGEGIITTADGSNEMVTETGRGIGQFTNEGKKLIFRGSFIFNTSSSTGKLAFLNKTIGVLEYEADEAGDSYLKVWEWK
jgi:hypothetical protein